MLKLVNATTGEPFLINRQHIVSVTTVEGEVFVWTDLDKQIGYKVSDSFAYIAEMLWAE